ncbi:MAG TPA: DUF3090 family protein [Ktedonobacteraceae bacterium]|nr:DUF3090 family protein [Ktedonobacteraceae bacterium]
MSVDLGPIDILGADAVGQPGQRRFRLFARSTRGSAVIWMEKEQLNSLSLAIDRFLALITEGQILRTEAVAGNRPSPGGMPADFPRQPTYDLQVGQIRLNYEERRAVFLFSVVPLEILMERGQEPQLVLREDRTLTFLFTQQQAQQLSNAIAILVTSGRPVCPLCGTPLDGSPHACEKQNGHHDILRIERETETDEEEE